MKTERTVGIGIALVDHKVRGIVENFPTRCDDLASFLEHQDLVVKTPGGPIPNTLTAYSLVSGDKNVKLYHSVGIDKNGSFYQQSSESFLGKPQINKSLPTGIWRGMINHEGKAINRVSVYGASTEIDVDSDEIEDGKNKLFVADVSSCRHPRIFEGALKIHSQLIRDNGDFVFSLGGARPSVITKEVLVKMVDSFKERPSIVFGNEREMCFFSGDENLEQVIESQFKESRILVITRGENGSMIRFKNETISIPPFLATDQLKGDEIGAGDAYMGTFLGLLYLKKPEEWTKFYIEKVAHAASFGASMVVESQKSRLSADQARMVNQFFNNKE